MSVGWVFPDWTLTQAILLPGSLPLLAGSGLVWIFRCILLAPVLLGAGWSMAAEATQCLRYRAATPGGITNWLAIKMLFDKVPGLYGRCVATCDR